MKQPVKQKKTFKQHVKKIKKVSVQKIASIKKGVRDTTNINRYNKYLFIFETILLVGVIDEFLESLIMKLDYGIYLNIVLLMLSIGILFYFALQFIEKLGKGTIIWIVRLNKNKILRIATHVLILSVLFYFYAKVFYSTEIGIVFNFGLTAS